MADGTVIQLDWAAVAAVATPISGAIAAAAKFGWSALFGYLDARDAVVIKGLTDINSRITDLAGKFEKADEQNRQDNRAYSDKLISAITENTKANVTQTLCINQLASQLTAKVAQK